MLSDTDNRVLALLRKRGQASVSLIGRECFREAGRPRDSGNLPAAAHLVRMVERGLVAKRGSSYVATEDAAQQDLF